MESISLAIAAGEEEEEEEESSSFIGQQLQSQDNDNISSITTVTTTTSGGSSSSFVQQHHNSNSNHASSNSFSLLQPFKEQEQEKRISSILSASRLRFDNLGLIGRDVERKIVYNCLSRLVNNVDDDETASASASASASKQQNNKNNKSQQQQLRQRKQRKRKWKELIMIRGEAGSGKSSLALSLKKHPALLLRRGNYTNNNNNNNNINNKSSSNNGRGGGIFVMGKYDMRKGDLPYAAIATVIDDLCKIIMTEGGTGTGSSDEQQQQLATSSSHEEERQSNENDAFIIRRRKSIVSSIISDIEETTLSILGTIVPSLNKLLLLYPSSSSSSSSSVDNNINSNNSNNNNNNNNIQRQHRCHRSTDVVVNREIVDQCFKTFFRVISDDGSSNGGPLCILLDDLQWADKESLDLLKVLINDNENDNLMIIGCYRSDEVEEVFDDDDGKKENDGNDEDEKTTHHMLVGVLKDLRRDALQQQQEEDEQSQQLQQEPNNNVNHSSSSFRMTEIFLDKFTVQDTYNLMQELLSMVDDTQQRQHDLMELAMLCHKRTSGNVYFLREFLSMLKYEKLLSFDIGTCRWKWDLHVIEERTVVTTNIIQLIEGRIKKIKKPGLIEILEIAACLGNRFDRRILFKVWLAEQQQQQQQDYNKTEENNDNKDEGNDSNVAQQEAFDALLNAAADEAILEARSLWSCRFAHDKIQESVINLIPKEDYKLLQWKVGNFLLRNLSGYEAEDMLFVVVDLLNASEQQKQQEFLSNGSVSSLNLRAARKAQSLTAFSSASTYVDFGIRNMLAQTTDYWNVNTDDDDDDNNNSNSGLALELFSIGAEVELCLGNVEKAVYYSRQIIDQNHIKPLDKVRAYKVLAKKLYMGRRPDESLKVSLDILGQLGYNFPRVKVAQQLQAKFALDAVRKRFSKINKDSLEQRGFISDVKILEAIPLLEHGASTALQAQNKSMYILLRSLCIELIIDHGLSNEAASCFASFANIMMHEKGDWETGVKLANFALAIQDRLGSRYTETSTLFKTNQLVLGWALPLKSRLKSIVKGYRSGMLSGNIEGGCWCLMLAICCQFYDGTPLRCVEEDCQVYIEKMESLRQKNQANMSKWYWQLILNLIGTPENPNTTVISGTAIAEEEAESMTAKSNMNTAKLFACAHFGDYATGAEIALKLGECVYERFSGMAWFGFERFDRGLCLYAHARRNPKQNKYEKAAKQVRTRLLYDWVSKGAVNLKHHLDILDAEDAALGKDRGKAKSRYEAAITTSARGGFLADAGLVNERYADFLVQDGEVGEARYRLEEAIKYYSEWGAMKKVELLRSSWSQVLA